MFRILYNQPRPVNAKLCNIKAVSFS